jgi:hypothetical protein
MLKAPFSAEVDRMTGLGLSQRIFSVKLLGTSERLVIIELSDDALESYDFMRKMYMRRIYPNVDGIRNALRLLTVTNSHVSRQNMWSTI